MAPVRILDITKPFKDSADITLCLEVMEHIPENLSGSVLDNLVRIAPKLVFSAAQPGAGGVGHINCQPKEFWRKEIEKRGFDYCPGETDFIIKRMGQPGVMGWLLNNIMVFRRKMEYPLHSMRTITCYGDITVTVTSCGRFHLLKRTIESFWKTNGCLYPIIISDDSEDTYQHDLILSHFGDLCTVLINGKNRGQAANLDDLYERVQSKYIFHMEDDWEFLADNAVADSKRIMEKDDGIGLVQLDLRPAYYKVDAVGVEKEDYFEYKTWRIDENHTWWHGWCGSPHLIRKSDWEKLGKFSQVLCELDYDMVYCKEGLRTVWAKRPYVRHIGYGQSTMGDYKWTK